MPVSSETSISGPFTPNGVTTSFPFDFKAASASEVVATDGDGNVISTALYSVTLDDDEGGTLTFGTAPEASDYPVIYVLSEPELTQPADFDNAGPSFNPAALTRAIDRAAIRDLKLNRDIGRALKLPFGEVSVTFPGVAERANKFVSFLPDGSLLMASGTGSDAGLREDLGDPAAAGKLIWFSDERSIDEALTEERNGINVLRDMPFAQVQRIRDRLVPSVDIEPYLQSAMAEAISLRTGMTSGAYAGNNPSSIDQYGLTKVLIPAGRYVVSAELLNAAQIFGLWICGDGANATILEVHADNVDVFTLDAYNHFQVSNLTIRHVAQSADPVDWTGNLFTCKGVGGGRQLKLFDCAFLGFNHGVIYPDGEIVNNDTCQVRGCDWYWQNKVQRGRNAQALINDWSACTIYGHGDGFDLAGVGYSAFRSLNVVINGSLLNIHGQTGLSGSSNQYLLENVKQEPYAYLVPGGLSSSALISVSGDLALVKASIEMINVGFTSSVNFEPTSAQVELTPNMRIDWRGGNLKPSARIVTHPANRINNAVFNGGAGLYMEGLLEAPPASQIARGSTATGQQTYAPVVYEGNDIVPSLFCGAKTGETSTFGPPDMGKARKRQAMGDATLRYPLLTAGAAKVQSILFHGFMQSIDDLEIHLRDKGAAELVIEISTDNFATTTQTIYVGGGATTQGRVVKASDPYIGSKTFDWADLATATTQSTTVTVRGARVGDRAEAVHGAALSGTRIWAEVTADDTVTVYQRNDTGSNQNVASATLTATVFPDRSRCICGVRTSVGLYVRYSGPLAVGFALADYTGR